MSVDLYLPAFTSIARHFGTSVHAVQFSLSTYLVGFAAGQVLYGPLSDRYGRRRPLAAGIALYVVASLACAAAPSIGALIGLRLVQGLCGCAGVVISRAIVRDMFVGAEAARFFSLIMLVFGVAPVLAPLLGGQLLAVVGWRGIFVTLAGYGLACLVGAFWLPETLAPAARRSGGLRGALASYREVVGHRAFLAYAGASSFANAALLAYIVSAPAVVIEQFGVSPQKFGFVFGANALGFVAVSQLNRWTVRRLGLETVLRRAVAAQALCGVALLAVAVTGAGGLAAAAVPMFGVVASLGAIMPNATALALTPFPDSAGAAAAVVGTLQTGLGAAAGAIVAAIGLEPVLSMAVVLIGACALAVTTLAALAPRELPEPAAETPS